MVSDPMETAVGKKKAFLHWKVISLKHSAHVWQFDSSFHGDGSRGLLKCYRNSCKWHRWRLKDVNYISTAPVNVLILGEGEVKDNQMFFIFLHLQYISDEWHN